MLKIFYIIFVIIYFIIKKIKMVYIEDVVLIELLKSYIIHNPIENIKSFIEEKKIDVNFAEGFMLIYSSLHNKLDIVKLLISHGANISIAKGRALKLATENGNTDIVEYLIENGAISKFYDNLKLDILRSNENGTLHEMVEAMNKLDQYPPHKFYINKYKDCNDRWSSIRKQITNKLEYYNTYISS